MTVTVSHPVIPGLTQTVPAGALDAWVDAGWLPPAPGAEPKSRKEWVALADRLGVPVPRSATIAAIKAAVVAHEAAQAAEEGAPAGDETGAGSTGAEPGSARQEAPEGVTW